MATNRLLRLDAAFIFFCGLILFTAGLSHQEIIGFESRFYLFALEMGRHGLAWFPTTYQEPYPDYPGTSTALIYLTAKLFGTLNKWVAVLPSAIAAALTLSATYLIGAIQSRKGGWYAVGFLLFTLAFITEARTISLDMYVAAATTWIFYLISSAKYQERTPPWGWMVLLLVASFAIRGPVGIVIPAGVASIFYLLEKDWRSWVIFSMLSFLLLIACTGILLAIAHHVGGDAFMQNVFHMEIAGRMEVNRTPPHYFYFKESIGAYAITYPLAILILAGSVSRFFKKNPTQSIRFLRSLAGWILVIMLGLSIPADKKVRYILSISPALALVCSYLIVTILNGFLHWTKKGFYWLCRLLPLLALGVLYVLYQKQVVLPYYFLTAFFIVIQMMMVIIRNNDTVFFLAVATFFSANVFIVEKINVDSNKTRDFVRQVEVIREKNHAKLAFYHEGRDGIAIKYLLNMSNEESPQFVSDISKTQVKSVFFVTSKENYYVLPESVRKNLHVMMAGRIGRDEVVVFSK
ncbi:MAG TPA: glycosyltransferase family 39 protein [Gammaproteobacteria bacterium]|nr:glycosyltransferase family 39 protein [Gammaproteobacteria bacterium]